MPAFKPSPVQQNQCRLLHNNCEEVQVSFNIRQIYKQNVCFAGKHKNKYKNTQFAVFIQNGGYAYA